MIGRNRTAPSAGHLFGWHTLQRPLSSQVHLVWPPLHLVLATASEAVRSTDSRQHPAGDVDAYAHTHAHADQLWGPQYENAKPSPFWRMLKTLSVYLRTPKYARSHKNCIVCPKFGDSAAVHYKVQYSQYFTGRCSVTIFLTDLDGTVTQHDGNVFGGRRFSLF